MRTARQHTSFEDECPHPTLLCNVEPLRPIRILIRAPEYFAQNGVVRLLHPLRLEGARSVIHNDPRRR